MARLPYRTAWVFVGPPLSASASSVNQGAYRSFSVGDFRSLVGMAERMQAVCAGRAAPSPCGSTSWRPPPSMLPPSDVTNQSQLPPRVLPATIVLRRIKALFALGGISGEKSDSTTPMPPPRGAELRQIVLLFSRNSPSASWKTPPPPTAAVLLEMVVFSMRASP